MNLSWLVYYILTDARLEILVLVPDLSHQNASFQLTEYNLFLKYDFAWTSSLHIIPGVCSNPTFHLQHLLYD